jgi:hypothetical protein
MSKLELFFLILSVSTLLGIWLIAFISIFGMVTLRLPKKDQYIITGLLYVVFILLTIFYFMK